MYINLKRYERVLCRIIYNSIQAMIQSLLFKKTPKATIFYQMRKLLGFVLVKIDCKNYFDNETYRR